MIKIVKIISAKIKEDKRLIKFLGLGRSDVQEKNQASPYGIDASPVKDMVAIVVPTSEQGKELIVGYINKNQIADTGEVRLYSTDDSGDMQIDLHLKKDGTAEFGGDSDFMVRFSALESAYNELRDDHNSLVATYNSHIHLTTATIGGSATPGVIAPTTSSETPSTGDISGAKIDEIKCS